MGTCCIHSLHNTAPTEPYNPLRPSSSGEPHSIPLWHRKISSSPHFFFFLCVSGYVLQISPISRRCYVCTMLQGERTRFMGEKTREEELNKKTFWLFFLGGGLLPIPPRSSPREQPYSYSCLNVNQSDGPFPGFLLNHPALLLPPSQGARLLLNRLPCREENTKLMPLSSWLPLSSCPWKENCNGGFDASLTCLEIFSP